MLKHLRFPLPLIALIVSCSGLTRTSSPPPEASTPVSEEAQAPPEQKSPAKPRQPEVVVRHAHPLPAVHVFGSQGIPQARGRLETLGSAEPLAEQLDRFHGWNPEHRLYIQLDRPLYQPGDTVWAKVWDVRASDFQGNGEGVMTLKLINPRGATVQEKKVEVRKGMSAGDFVVDAGAVGGEYTLQAIAADNQVVERKLVISRYEPPRIKKTLDFLRESYGPGDEVTATLTVERAAGGPLANHPLTGIVQIDGAEVARLETTTDARGGAVARFSLPGSIQVGDGLLTVLVEDGGITESISRSIPIVLNDFAITLFPEGGDLVAGLPARVYLEALDSRGESVDVSGYVIDSDNRVVDTFTTHVGRGRFSMVPRSGESYRFMITTPREGEARVTFPEVQAEGCVMSTFDDPAEALDAIVVGVRCSAEREVVVVGWQRGHTLDVARLAVPAGDTGAVAYLEPSDKALVQATGVARVTLLDAELRPMAERLVFRNRSQQLHIELESKQRYTPRDTVKVEIRTTTPNGKPVPAELALSAVDDTVLNLADDKQGHILSQLYLMPELRDGAHLDEPNRYFDASDPNSAVAMDLLLGTRGWRRFDWSIMLSPDTDGDTLVDALDACPADAEDRDGFQDDDGCPDTDNDFDGIVDADDRCPDEAEWFNGYKDKDGCPEKDTDADGIADGIDKCKKKPEVFNGHKDTDGCPDENKQLVKLRARRADVGGFDDMMMAPQAAGGMGGGNFEVAEGRAGGMGKKLEEKKGRIAKKKPQPKPKEVQRKDDDANVKLRGQAAEAEAAGPDARGIWPVRTFPVPRYKKSYDGPRNDFRQTVYWAPTVRTNRKGRATVSFPVSDAITSFRISAEGLGGGVAGRAEHVIESILPMSLAVKLPLEVSAGDTLNIPLIMTNERDSELVLDVEGSFGELVSLTEESSRDAKMKHRVQLAPRSRDSLFVPLTVTGVRGISEVVISAEGGGLSDAFERTIKVVPRGFPQVESVSGRAQGGVEEKVNITAPVAGTMTASVRVFPTPAASLVGGMEGMLRQPSGCFEQTSSSNFPNVMVLNYLKAHDVQDAALMERANALLDAGYKRLVSYESPEHGYEWFGAHPGHEALTAYGLVEFNAMADIYDIDKKMLDRTADWLIKRRDGEGGFQRNAKALDAFGAADPQVTDAYITWALSEAGYHDIPKELERQRNLARSSDDPYLVALAANTFLNLEGERALGVKTAERLVEMQGEGGSWTSPGHSITRSGGVNLTIETTALTTTALMKAEVAPQAIEQGMGWLSKNRGGFGQWGATQATVLALDTMTRFAAWSAQTKTDGAVVLTVNGTRAGRVEFTADLNDPIVLDDFAHLLIEGENTFALDFEGENKLGYTIAVEYNTHTPRSSPQTAVSLDTSLSTTQAPMGETVRLTATVTNVTAGGQPMTLARIGIPAGLTAQEWQLKELRDKGVYDFYETRAREVILYYRALAPNATHTVHLDLVAAIPGKTVGPASSAYLYYTDDHKMWTEGLEIEVLP